MGIENGSQENTSAYWYTLADRLQEYADDLSRRVARFETELATNQQKLKDDGRNRTDEFPTIASLDSREVARIKADIQWLERKIKEVKRSEVDARADVRRKKRKGDQLARRGK